MAETWKSGRLHYLDADDINDDRVDFNGLDVRNAAGDKLGDVDGFIVDRSAARPYYVVVDSGGWFSSQRYLVPIGHARFDTANHCLRVDLEKETLSRFPEFDANRFTELNETDARRFTEQTLNACCPTELAQRTGDARWDYDSWSHYRQPDWWQDRWIGSRSLVDAPYRTTTPASEVDVHASDVTRQVTATPPREYVIAHADRDLTIDRDREPGVIDRDRDRVAIDPTDRAQPGDVLGIETGGETTELGDTAKDETERLHDAEESVTDRREDELEDPRERVRNRDEDILRDRDDAAGDRNRPITDDVTYDRSRLRRED